MMTKVSDMIFEAARRFTLEEIIDFLRKEYLPKLSKELQERDEMIISLIEQDLMKQTSALSYIDPRRLGVIDESLS